MKLKEFLKSSSFKCIVVLLLIALVCGTILAVSNDLFYVSDQEMFARSMAKIYTGDASALVQKEAGINKVYSTYDCESVILDVRTDSTEKTWLVRSKGNKCGYSNGSVILWVSLSVEGGQLSGINKVILDDYDSSQSLIGAITQDFLDGYASSKYDNLVKGGGHFTNAKMTKTENIPATEAVASGASFTSKAVNAAVNGAMDLVREMTGGAGA
ncbi:MAG: hypothetical protein J6Y68_05250 [Clostridia bacterium]|nr:hypothetical protein [Clostridia bacterium]